MRISKKELRKIIKEEIEAVTLEEIFTLDDIGTGLRKGYDALTKRLKDRVVRMEDPFEFKDPPAAGETTGQSPFDFATGVIKTAVSGPKTTRDVLNLAGVKSARELVKKYKYNHPLRKKYRELYRKGRGKRKAKKTVEPKKQQSDLTPRTQSQVERYNAGQARVNLERLKNAEKSFNKRGKNLSTSSAATSLAATVLKDTPPGVAKDAVRGELQRMGFDTKSLETGKDPRTVPGKRGGKESLKVAGAALGGDVK